MEKSILLKMKRRMDRKRKIATYVYLTLEAISLLDNYIELVARDDPRASRSSVLEELIRLEVPKRLKILRENQTEGGVLI